MIYILSELLEKTEDELVNLIYNDWIRDHSDLDVDFGDGGKSIPYIGWFWRQVDFVNKSVSIGDCGEFIGVMENNKWDYRGRLMTEQEVDKFIEYIDTAIKSSNESECNKVLRWLWDWFQTLKV